MTRFSQKFSGFIVSLLDALGPTSQQGSVTVLDKMPGYVRREKLQIEQIKGLPRNCICWLRTYTVVSYVCN
jgi:hypothetical protein